MTASFAVNFVMKDHLEYQPSENEEEAADDSQFCCKFCGFGAIDVSRLQKHVV